MFSDKYSVYADLSCTSSKNIRIRAEKGTVTCLAGPEKSGKSMLVEMMAGLRKAEGEVLINGMKWSTDEVAIKTKVSFVYDSINFSSNASPDRIAHEIIAFEDNFDYEFFCEKMESFELNKRRKIISTTKDVKALVKVILALSRRPEILIMDEPFGHIDFEYRVIIIRLLQEFMQDSNHTLIFTFDTREDESRFNYFDFTEYKKFLEKMKESVDDIILLETGEVISNGSRKVIAQDEVKPISDDSQEEEDDDDSAIFTLLKFKKNIIKWSNMLCLYFGDGSSKVHRLRDFYIWFVLLVFASFLTGYNSGKYNYNVSFIPFVIVCTVCVISRVFENKKSLILTLGISWRQHIRNSYITSALMIILIISSFTFFLTLFSGGKAVSGNNIIYYGSWLNASGLIFISTFYITMFFMYFPLAFIAKRKVWWAYAAGVSVVLYSIIYITRTAFKIGSIYKGNGNFIARFESIPYYQWYLFGLLVICTISTRLSVRISKYFYMKI